MKKLIPFSFALTLIFLVTGCKPELTTRTANGVYEIGVPPDMTSTKGLNQDASMQYENIYEESYLAIIDEDKQAFKSAYTLYGAIDESKSIISNYAKIQIDFFHKGVNEIEKKEPRQLTINGRDAEQVEFTASVAGVDNEFYYLITFVEGEKNVYMIMSWTLAMFEADHKSTFVDMANSFKEL